VAEDLPDKVVRQEEPEWPVSRIDEIHTLIQCFKITSEQLGKSFTQLQVANVELTEAKHQAELANRTKSEFLANISHDLRTPLNGILGYAQILARDTSLDERVQNAVSIIEKSGNHLLNLINDILDVSRIEADKLHLDREPFFLGSFLDDIADIVSLQARQKGLQLFVDFSDELHPVVVGDEKRLRQVLLNLLNNAVKFTPKGHVRFSARTEGETLQIEVEDTGIGIPEDELEAIFSPFKQLTKHIQSEEGTGLGLAIVKRLVTMMDGEVSVESTPGKGSRFSLKVTLPPADTHGIEWIHRRDEAPEALPQTEIKVPPLDELQALAEQAESGNIRGIVDAADMLAAQNEAYRPFVRKVTGMAQEFEINKLVGYLGQIKIDQETRRE